jgi:hypothetical protein
MLKFPPSPMLLAKLCQYIQLSEGYVYRIHASGYKNVELRT